MEAHISLFLFLARLSSSEEARNQALRVISDKDEPCRYGHVILRNEKLWIWVNGVLSSSKWLSKQGLKVYPSSPHCASIVTEGTNSHLKIVPLQIQCA